MEAFEHMPRQKPIERKQIMILCEDLSHKNEIVQYILLKPKADVRSRLLCRKCIEGKFNQQTNEICLISEVLDDPYKVLKYSNYQGNVNQILNDFLHSYDFSFDVDAIRYKIEEIRQRFLYHLDELEKKLIEKYEQYQGTKAQVDNLKAKFESYFDITKLEESLTQAGMQFGKLTTKDKQKLRKGVNDYVAQIHRLNQDQADQEVYKTQFNVIDQNKRNLAEKESQLRLQKEKLDQGCEKIIKELQNMEQTYSTLNFRQSELSTTYMDEFMARVNHNFKQRNNFMDKIKRIYQSKYDGLNPLKVHEKIISLGQWNTQTLLFLFQTSSQQVFGVYVSSNSSEIFHQNKKQEFVIKRGVDPLTLNYSNNQADVLLTFGKGDIIIKSSFNGCLSDLGEGFQDKPEYNIGNLKRYLANQDYFDIVEMEIFQILK
ncbi:unnamed protein product (macronuclear) [Paramecium tetraurelia]|uniref:TLDc domain-containing protein n=1 Tax=Paramecium tetraurelia TaxID=5888 RepID=A0CZR0_PARTE|nr:uncharacterized protein GSPATT00011850001 [Paramecium tetraurelia]CAK76277.1 unnamed protein product [Paramecium tetraurelia]|eukprot:XP_001443674.1 hypothetical protein (macronuclear) [Paramecium tetraurelia strain d4-2]